MLRPNKIMPPTCGACNSSISSWVSSVPAMSSINAPIIFGVRVGIFKEKTIPEFCNDLLHFVSREYDKTTRHKHIKLFKILNLFNSGRKPTR